MMLSMNKKQRLILIALICATFFHSAWATLNQIVQKADAKVVMGVMVQDATTGRIVYQYNADRLFLPASSMKIFTAVASLLELGPNFHFPTNVYTDAKFIQGGILTGNLYVTFSGDPTLTSADIVYLLEILRKRGIKQINGNVVLTFPFYTAQKYPPGGSEKDHVHPFGAPVTPVIIDQNALTFIISTTGAGQHANVSIHDPSGRIQFDNQLYTKKLGERCGLSYHLEGNFLSLKGCVAPRKQPYVERIALTDPASYAEGVVAMAIKHWGIIIKGKILQSSTPKSAILLESHASEALPVILSETLKPSNNVFANALYLKVGQMYWHQMATWKNSGLAVKFLLERYAKVSMKSATIIDGAGLSRDNRVTPRQMVDMLYKIKQHFELSNHFISALPVPGQKGTLIHRHIAADRLQRNIHAKTGTMKGIVGLAGYLPSANHHELVFAILTNATTPLVFKTDQVFIPLWKYKGLEDEICRYLMSVNT